MPDIRVLESSARPMQRLGYLKRLTRRVLTLSTTSLDNLGHDLTETAMRKVRVPLNQERADYVKKRLTDGTYKSLKDATNVWLSAEEGTEPPVVAMELQDLYLADAALPSQTGKLVKNDWRKYPALGIGLGLVRGGSYSANTRALSLLHFTPAEELQAFIEYDPKANPLRLSQQQALLLLYAFLENDGEIIAPLWSGLKGDKDATFTDRDAGDLLPDIYRQTVARHRRRLPPADERDRLRALEKSAESIATWQERERTSWGGSREEASRPRVEPYADMGLLEKPDPTKYEYMFSRVGMVWVEAFAGERSSSEISEFLARSFFSVAANALEINSRLLTDPEDVIGYLYRASRAVQSPGGYSPIEELALVAGIEALLNEQYIIEPETARDILLAYQKANPYKVRFTVNRLGVLAHARFLEAPVSVADES